jgi:hypothetical protein
MGTTGIGGTVITGVIVTGARACLVISVIIGVTTVTGTGSEPFSSLHSAARIVP